jgi:hypothetical protein
MVEKTRVEKFKLNHKAQIGLYWAKTEEFWESKYV